MLTDDSLRRGWFRLVGVSGRALAAAVMLTACGAAPDDQQAEPLAPQPYGDDVEPNVELWLDTLELSSRELYSAREEVLEAIALKEGEAVADVGSGTGLYTLLFAPKVGEDGVVYAVDIEPRFLKHVSQRVADLDLHNVVAVLSRPEDITLPRHSVDVVFIADTYHYFDDARSVMASVRAALRPGGRLVIVEYDLEAASERSPDKDHVRFGRAGLIAEVSSFGFRLLPEPDAMGLAEFYMAVFEKDE